MKSFLITGILVGLICPCARSRAADPAERFPEVKGWTFTRWEKTYTRENLWDSIDGAADLFLSYGFTDLHIGRYVDSAGTDVRVELYGHDSRANAFGIYSQERNPDYHFIDVGTQGYIEDGVLNFLCGSYYVKISSQAPGKEGRDAMMLIAQRVEERLGGERGFPPELALFPSDGRLANTESYVSQNFLGYSFLHSAYVAEFDAGGSFKMFIIDAGTADQVEEMVTTYQKASGQPVASTDEGTYRIPDPFNGDVYLLVKDKYLSGVYGCADPQVAQHHLSALAPRLAKALKR
jgi:hypothetical protein